MNPTDDIHDGVGHNFDFERDKFNNDRKVIVVGAEVSKKNDEIDGWYLSGEDGKTPAGDEQIVNARFFYVSKAGCVFSSKCFCELFNVSSNE